VASRAARVRGTNTDAAGGQESYGRAVRAPMGSAARSPRIDAVKVLLVDDSVVVRVRLASRLREIARVKVVVEACNAFEASARIQEHTVDVVVLDLNLSVESGLALLPRIKATRAAPYVIVLTNNADEQHRRHALTLGADAFIDKSKASTSSPSSSNCAGSGSRATPEDATGGRSPGCWSYDRRCNVRQRKPCRADGKGEVACVQE
jgi:two-component system response regulator DevR